jgi:hypothetical protein
MIYKARELNSYLNNLVLVGQEDGRLEWVGTNDNWYNAEMGGFTVEELIAMQDTEESDRYDLSTCHK